MYNSVRNPPRKPRMTNAHLNARSVKELIFVYLVPKAMITIAIGIPDVARRKA